MTEVVIRHCILRVVRHGGRSWGPDRRGLVDRVTRMLPQLIAARLEELLGEADGEIAEPIRVAIKLNGVGPLSDAGLREAVSAALTADSLPLQAGSGLAPPRSASQADPIAAISATPLEDAGLSAAMTSQGLRALLLRWRNQGDLLRRLRGFSPVTLRAWLTALVQTVDRSAEEPEVDAEVLAREAATIRDRLIEAGGLRGHTDRLRLLLMVELAARHRRLPPSDRLWRMIDTAVPPASTPAQTAAAAGALPATEVDAASPPVQFSGPDQAVRRATPAAQSRPVAPTLGKDVALCSVLPFLVLGMLRRIGWLEVASATFEALAMPDRGAVFATALAYKLLPPPRKGWHRNPEILRTAAAFAGLDFAPSPAAFEAWHRDAEGGLSAIDGFVVTELANGHDVEQPLLIARPANHLGAGWLLLDADGLFPVAWAGDEGSLLSSLAEFGPSVVVVVSAEAASPELIRGLIAARRAFVTDARPGRGEDLQRLAGMPGIWTSAAEASPDRLRAAAKRQAELEAAAAGINRALITERPVVPGRDGLDIERATLLSASTGLGMLAWTLWRDREAVDPLLALDRLGDLDGSARFTEAAVAIRPAIGRRYLDLKEHKVLDDIPGVPWLGGRTVTFVGP